MAGREVRTTSCPLDCPDTCTLAVTVDDGRIVDVGAAPGNPFTQGFICQKVSRHAQRVYAPERMRLRSSGPGRRAPASSARPVGTTRSIWSPTRIRRAQAEDGPASVVPWIYSSSAAALQTVLPARLFRLIGASEVDDTICAATFGKAWDEMFPNMLSADPLDVAHAQLVVVWGSNPAVSNTHFPPLVRRAQQAGAQLVVVDPRRTAMAKRADLHVTPRPGTDVALALAIARELVAQDALDREFLAEHAEGVDAFLAAADEWTLARAEEVTGVGAAVIARLAGLLAAVRPAYFRVGWGLERTRNGGSACAAVFALPVLTGQFGVPGSGVYASTLGRHRPRRAPGTDARSAAGAEHEPPRPLPHGPARGSTGARARRHRCQPGREPPRTAARARRARA